MKIDVESLPPTLPNKKVAISMTAMSKEGSVMKTLFFYKIISEVVNTFGG